VSICGGARCSQQASISPRRVGGGKERGWQQPASRLLDSPTHLEAKVLPAPATVPAGAGMASNTIWGLSVACGVRAHVVEGVGRRPTTLEPRGRGVREVDGMVWPPRLSSCPAGPNA
jgi:hypothetical protein